MDATKENKDFDMVKKSGNHGTTFVCQFGRYGSTRLPVRVAPAGGMFQWKIDEVFKELPNGWHCRRHFDYRLNSNGRDNERNPGMNDAVVVG